LCFSGKITCLFGGSPGKFTASGEIPGTSPPEFEPSGLLFRCQDSDVPDITKLFLYKENPSTVMIRNTPGSGILRAGT
jgi:hypothetical protein